MNHNPMHLFAFITLLVLLLCRSADAGELGFAEEFALAKDRDQVLKQLIPGTEDYYYYHALHYLNTEQFEKVDALTTPWHTRHGQTAKLNEIQTRYALLNYDRDPKKSGDYFRRKLNLNYPHQKETTGVAANIPTSLDQKLISRETLKANSWNPNNGLDAFEDSALDWLATENLSWQQRRNLLQRLQRPDYANLVQLIDADLKAPNPVAFASYSVENQLTIAQLEELLKVRPDLLNDANLVLIWLTKLLPGADENPKRNPAVHLAHLERLQQFATRLGPVHNSLKAHILYHRLVYDRSQGKYDAARFLEYLKLPRQQYYMAKDYNEREDSRQFPAQLGANYTPQTQLPIVGSDEALVRSYLKHFFADTNGFKEYEPYLESSFLRAIFAETKIELGLGEPEQWASQLSPEQFRAIKDRIDIKFAATNVNEYSTESPVKLGVYVKNVQNMIVKVFEMNTGNIYKTTLKEIDTDFNLDGLVANSEQNFTYNETPYRRVLRTFTFPELTKPGVYMIDFIGSGKSSRALIRKGRLSPIMTVTAVGHRFTIVDENQQLVKDASITLSTQTYQSDKDGNIDVPFVSTPGQNTIVISRGALSTLESVNLLSESYILNSGIYIDRESLLSQRTSRLIVRAGLTINGNAISIKTLKNVRLRITAIDQNNIKSTTVTNDFLLFEDRESVQDFRVPPRVSSLEVTLLAEVKQLSTGQDIELTGQQLFTLNQIDKTERIEDLHFSKFGENYVCDLLGRSGEVKPNRPIQVTLKHQDFRNPITVMLKTDAAGRINLGPLVQIDSVTAVTPEGTTHRWTIPTNHYTYQQSIHAKVGDSISVPYLGTAAKPTREEFALFGQNSATVLNDQFDSIQLVNGMVELKNLVAGDYELWLKDLKQRIKIRVTSGKEIAGSIVGATRTLQTNRLPALQVREVSADAETLTIRLTNATKFTRVHLFATRFLPAYSVYEQLSNVRRAELGGYLPGFAPSVYLSGRNIGDEYRYVLDRRGMKIYPGTMLDRPMLLLNPWAIRETKTGEQNAQVGEGFNASLKREESVTMAPKPVTKPGMDGLGRDDAGYANLDFLRQSSGTILNLVPDADGVVKVSTKELGSNSFLRIVAADPTQVVVKNLSRPEVPSASLDLRLSEAAALDPTKHFTQQKLVTQLAIGQAFTIEDVTATRFEYYDSLQKVHTLYSALLKDPKLAEFSFVLGWTKLKIAEKQALYSKYACHELNFFLSRKDPEFFKAVVQPYLKNKKDQTFLDQYLLDADLKIYLQPWHYHRLNSVERVLLARRMTGEASKTARHLDETLRLAPPRSEREEFLFQSALSNMDLGLDSDLKAGIANLQDLSRDKNRLNDPQAAMPPAPAGPLGGAGAPDDSKSGRAGAAKSEDSSPRRRSMGEMKKDEKGKDRAETEDGPKQLEKQSKEVELLFENGREDLPALRQLYRQVAATQEWAENNYYKMPIVQQVGGLILPSPFWLDYCRHEGNVAFLSKQLPDASRNFTEAMFALAVLDLPAESPKHEVKFDGPKLTLTPAGPTIVFHEEIRAIAIQNKQSSILLSQNFYRQGERYRDENGERFDKFVEGEFVVHTVYGCQVVVTNPTSARQKLTIIVQVPQGAIPLANAQFTRTISVTLEPYRTQAIDYLFYFPKAGQFAQFPVHVARGESLVSFASPTIFNVVAVPTKLDQTSWDYVSQNGTNEDVLAFLNRENLQALNLEKIAFRMRDRAMFESTIRILTDRHLFQPVLWSYSLMHADGAAINQYLMHTTAIVNECGGPLTSPVLSVDPVARHSYEHLEYYPLVNARAHALGQQRQIVNQPLFEQYSRLMKLLSYRKSLTSADRLAVVSYLLRQDRITEAMEHFTLVDRAQIATQLQYDYCAAYFAVLTEDYTTARATALKHTNHPVDRWRNRFSTIISQLDEAQGKPGVVNDADDQVQRQAQLAASEPSLELTLQNEQIQLSWQNVKQVTLNYYLMDVELLFSRNPFVQQSGSQFASIRPNMTREIKLDAGKTQMLVPIPEEFRTKNVLVEVVADGKSRSVPYYASTMAVKYLESYGQLKVSEAKAEKPIAKVYVKVYAKLANGQTRFYKDGYTDLRGRFDYATVSTLEASPVQKFSILVLSPELGANIREVVPPQR